MQISSRSAHFCESWFPASASFLFCSSRIEIWLFRCRICLFGPGSLHFGTGSPFPYRGSFPLVICLYPYQILPLPDRYIINGLQKKSEFLQIGVSSFWLWITFIKGERIRNVVPRKQSKEEAVCEKNPHMWISSESNQKRAEALVSYQHQCLWNI